MKKEVLFFAQADNKKAYFTNDLKHALPFESKEVAWQIANLCTIVSGFRNSVKKHSISDLYLICHERTQTEFNTLVNAANADKN